MNTLWQDLRYGARMLAKKPSFTLIAVLTLALGIGANTALFSLVDAVLLKQLPVRQPEQLVLFKWVMGPKGLVSRLDGIARTDPATGRRISTSFSYPAFEQFRAHSRTLADVFAFAPLDQLNVNVAGQAEIASGQLVTGGYYSGLGVPARLGRTITNEDDLANAPPVAVISHRYWRQRFGLDPATVGQTVTVNNVPVTIIGIAPPQFHGTLQVGQSPDLSLPMTLQPRLIQGASLMPAAWNWWVRVMGRLQPGVNVEQARAELEGLFQQSALEGWKTLPPERRPQDQSPRDLPNLQLTAGGQGLNDAREAYQQPLRILLIFVGLVLLIACANVANLLLAQATARRQEIAVRLALGAGRWRLIRQLLTESVLLAAAGGALGWLLAWWAKDLLLMWHPWGDTYLELELQMNWRVFGFAAALALLTSLLFGLAPALRATRVELAPALKENTRGASGSLSLLSKSLVVAQVALSLLLLVGAGLFVRTLRNLQGVELGFNAENLLLFRVDPRLNGYEDKQIARLYPQMIERIEAIPGVRSATLSRHPLLSGSAARDGIITPGQTQSAGASAGVYLQRVRWNFFATMEMPLLAGRSLNAQDDERAPQVAVVNQALARKLFNTDNPVGQRFGFGNDPKNSGQIEIVGIVRDAKYTGQRQDIPPTVYIPYQQQALSQMNFEVRTATDPHLLIAAVREAVRQVDANLPLFEIKTQREQAAAALAQERLFARLTSVFGLLALALACIGLYGMLSYAVTQRLHEVAIRLALGAQRRDVLRLVLGQGMIITFIGIGLGLGGALALTRWLKSSLYGVSATDPLTFVAIAALLAGVALLACYVPARRATKVDPMTALRYE